MLSQSEAQKESRAPVSTCHDVSFLFHKSGLNWCSLSLAFLFLRLDPESPGFWPLPPGSGFEYDFAGSLGPPLWLPAVLGDNTLKAGSALTTPQRSMQTTVRSTEAGSLCHLS